ncbi:Ferritin-like domain-containing protein [Helicosporidium sp. ATCC 50920]|nr:Ferritin-like domain-containing protein [Helicosporidium sp. ATCC 50920]|eukprot:KDD74319.1 Ferritin-like domain-containing protein [Helicosporidium sp. ATCC 50920]
MVFQPSREVSPLLKSTSAEGGHKSLARNETYTDKLEAGINEQITAELTLGYVYQSMSAYFARDTVALHGVSSYFDHEAGEERGHAQKLIDFQNSRGGRVVMGTLAAPECEYGHAEHGDALYAFSLALLMEKGNFARLLALWELANKHGDPQSTSWLEDMLHEQAADVKKAADYVAQLRRVGKGHGVWHFDRTLAKGDVDAKTI